MKCNSLVPSHFDVPEILDTGAFSLVPLAPPLAELDYEAVMASLDRLQGIFGPTDDWPQRTLTLAENKASLVVHWQEFVDRQAFAYSVLTPTRDRCLGSVYIDPSRVPAFDCEVCFWLRNDSPVRESEFKQLLGNWLTTAWPFERIAYPGRDIPWPAWQALL